MKNRRYNSVEKFTEMSLLEKDEKNFQKYHSSEYPTLNSNQRFV